MGAIAVSLAGRGVHAQHVSPGPASEPGALEVSPASPRLSVMVGDSVRFTAAAEGVREFTWSLWGRVVSHDPVWEYVPAPEDAGWQRVQLDVLDVRGTTRTHAWEVGVIAAVPPELVEVLPPAGRVDVPAHGQVRLRCAARVRAARARDRLRFRWEVDDQIVRRDEPGDASGSSELTVPVLEPGTHRAVVRVTEDGRASSLTEWTLVVAPRLRRRLVARVAPGRVDWQEGKPLAIAVGVEPGGGRATYDWVLDGRRVRGGQDGRFEQRALAPGRHRLDVRAVVDGVPVGSLAWSVVVRPSTSVAAARPSPSPTVRTTSAPPDAEPEARLDEAEVRAWLEEYAHAWSRKDVAALQRMGQVRSVDEAERLERYFGSIGALHVEVRVLALHVEGERAAVHFERVDTVTDPTGRRQELRLPPLYKQIERTPEGLRFADDGGRG